MRSKPSCFLHRTDAHNSNARACTLASRRIASHRIACARAGREAGNIPAPRRRVKTVRASLFSMSLFPCPTYMPNNAVLVLLCGPTSARVPVWPRARGKVAPPWLLSSTIDCAAASRASASVAGAPRVVAFLSASKGESRSCPIKTLSDQTADIHFKYLPTPRIFRDKHRSCENGPDDRNNNKIVCRGGTVL